MSHEPKVKKVEPSIFLGIDSPIVIFHGDLDDLVPDLSSGSGASESGGATSGGESSVPVGTKDGPVHGYLAMCDATNHHEALAGVQPGGTWVGPHQLRLEDAHGDAHGHEDGTAYVVLHVGTVFIGPVRSG